MVCLESDSSMQKTVEKKKGFVSFFTLKQFVEAQ